ncbi:Uncharacterised protein [Achromobacter xylosoxidans]|jgi:hypothetical protein|uniref:hypothetical protein n=1 Tax=Alcaligenes xylosoxydans xylosoxydans TaxID=85698 RepID=UPI0003323366|nr:hypothetical protein [Achromobacter xylosoxidans]MCH4592710.1 hypothetical protein [Achromobacter xylosoxidans]CCH09797.1 hypothetical protein NH44784_058551 [Achromobacter xylosoxidans NH44784-1996]CUI32566.1 Uncharacterised protein [Achromobacter xylosoxidans]CUI68726.1 Uncharacterised protein [Achromobacter xylosoxidans]
MRIPCPFPHRAGLLLLAALALAPLTAGAQTAPAAQATPVPPPASTAGPAPGGACIETEVNGYRALSYGCLNQKMAPDAAPRPPPELGSEAITQRPPNQMGLPTPATIGNRMGNTFGTSAYPQRPTP